MKFGCNRLKLWTDDGRTDDGRRTTEPAYTISSPGAFGSGELKMCLQQIKYHDCALILQSNYTLIYMAFRPQGEGQMSKLKVKVIYKVKCKNCITNMYHGYSLIPLRSLYAF